MTLSIEPAPFYVQSSKVGVSQIIRNILNNSIRFTNTWGFINVAIEDLGSEIKISISDTGKGIPQNELENIFVEHYQIDDSSKNTSLSAGEGPGLSIVDRLAKTLAIPLEIKSTGGRGTNFSLKLHKLDQKLIAATRSPDASSLGGFQIVVLLKTKILVLGLPNNWSNGAPW
ncbi:MAG: ATP-binding protein [Gammaproteobacteria bacterium]|nr:ATP-binding protein [Gammaproteobacteria bacterium]